MKQAIDENYTQFYSGRRHTHIYPTEFVVRTFLAEYPELEMIKPKPGDNVLDVGCGDGRNALFLLQQNYKVHATEITEGICEQTKMRIESNGYSLDIRVGRNSCIPFEDETMDYLLACHSCYYCDEGETISDNLREYSRVLKPGGVLIASVVHTDSYILKGAERQNDGTYIVRQDPYNNRNGYRLYGFGSVLDIQNVFSPFFEQFSFGQGHNNWYGIDENVFWLVGHKVAPR